MTQAPDKRWENGKSFFFSSLVSTAKIDDGSTGRRSLLFICVVPQREIANRMFVPNKFKKISARVAAESRP